MQPNIIYTMMKECVVKKQSEFRKYEDAEYSKQYDLFRLCHFKLDTIPSHTYTIDELTSFGIDEELAISYINNKYLMETELDENTKTMLLSFKRNKVLNSYIEKNEYVRILAGMPPLSIPTLSIKLNEFISSLDISQVRLDMNIWELTDIEIQRVYKLKGSLDFIYEKYPYEFIKYLHRKSSIIEIRDANEYALIRCGHYDVPSEYEELYEEMYNKGKLYFLYVLKNEFYQAQFPNYEILCILYLIFSAGTQTAIKASYEIIDFSDKEFITAYLNSNGIDYIDLPQTLMGKFIEKLSTLIALKGSKQCLLDIKDIFDVNTIYRYVLKKNIKIDNYDISTPNSEKYDISFVRVPLGETNIRKVFENEEYISYADMVEDDPLWGVGDDNLYDKLIETEFNYLETKYISIENMMEITKNTYQYTSLFRYILNNPDISSGYTFTYKRGEWFNMDVFQGFLYISLLIIKMRGYEDVLPDTIDGISYVMGWNEIEPSKLIWRFKILFTKEEFRNTPFYLKSISDVKDVYSFMDVFMGWQHAMSTIDKVLANTSDYEEYSFIKSLKSSIEVAKTLPAVYTVDGNKFTTYEGYLRYMNPPIGTVLDNLSTDNNRAAYQDEIVYIIDLINKVLNSTNDTKISPSLSTLDDIRDEYGGNINKLLKEVLKYFISMSVTIKDFSLVFKIDNTTDRFAVLEKFRSHGNIKRAEVMNVFGDTLHSHNNRKMYDSFENDGGIFCVTNRFGIEKIV